MNRKGFTLIELLVVIVIIGILAAIALPNYIKVKDKAKEAEVKSNLHNIQLNIERFAVDTGGTYPDYLIGGQGKFSRYVEGSANAFVEVQDCPDRTILSDPLLRKGYIDSYPKNPFATQGAAIHRFQQDRDDPMRNGSTGDDLGTRFGPFCTLMGNVLADFRYRTYVVIDQQSGTQYELDTMADIAYPFFDLWRSNKPNPFLPGEFFYKSSGVIVSSGENLDATRPIIPTVVEIYMLGGYGSIRTKGRDVLGPEPFITFSQNIGGAGGSGNVGEPIPAWTRSTMDQDEDSNYLGSPYGEGKAEVTVDQLSYGQPNGIRDGIILILVPGEDTKGARD